MTEKNTDSTGLQSAISGLRSFFDVRAGLFWGLVMGAIVWIINAMTTTPHDYGGASVAAGKQAIYTFCIGGVLTRIVSWLSLRPGRSWLVIVNATVFTTAIAGGLVFLVHSLRGTPSPLLSSLPTTLMTFVGTPFLAASLRRKRLNK